MDPLITSVHLIRMEQVVSIVMHHFSELVTQIVLCEQFNFNGEVFSAVVAVFRDHTGTGSPTVALHRQSIRMDGQGETTRCLGTHCSGQVPCIQKRVDQAALSYHTKNGLDNDQQDKHNSGTIPTPESPTNPTVRVGGH